ncbi:hypothetical protein [Spirosoma rhododendri]|uniref:Outer membrane protein beta-barrel domain-containing protein n=1 Tax=Spirosoma rhododendri TaxID=2728024 RepID=A0A7L5DKV3_9BACT|nr:hypothetical protein [Spirosoma rhododendri]QJD78152.1 hypothetical protein HH216_06735 [Spirosoma rhododendri]
MQELPDDQLDGLFRKSLEESEPPYDPAAWQTMQDKLNAHDKQQFWQRWLTRGLPVLLLLLLSTGIWLIADREPAVSTTAPIATSTSRLATVEQTDHKAHLTEESDAGRTRRSVEPLPTPTVSETSGEQSADQPKSTVVSGELPDKPALQRQSGTPTSVPSVAGKAQVARVRKPLSEPRSGVTRQTEFVGQSTRRVDMAQSQTARFYARPHARTADRTFTDQPTGRTVGETTVQTVGELPDADNAPADRFTAMVALLPSPLSVPSAKSARIDRDVEAPASTSSVSQPTVERIDKTTGLSIRMLVSPDLSTIGLTNFSRPGTNVGLMLEYQYQRWRIQAGALRSVKVYQATEPAGEYANMGQWSVKPSSIGGRCNMLDIPINLRYDIALLPRRNAMPPSRWFVSAGTTTYYMLREDYTYNYDNPADPKIKYRDWTTETGRYGFSQLNISGGYERAITRRLYWQVEPFLKVPLKGVGFYKVNLLSTGVFFSLRYSLQSH